MNRDWEFVEAGLRTTVPVGRNLLWATIAGGTDLGSQLPPDRAFALGGTTFPGYQLDELWRLIDVMPIQNKAIYGGFAFQAGRVYDRR